MVPGLLFKNKIMNFQANNELLLNMNVKSIRSNMEINMLLKYILNYSFCFCLFFLFPTGMMKGIRQCNGIPLLLKAIYTLFNPLAPIFDLGFA